MNEPTNEPTGQIESRLRANLGRQATEVTPRADEADLRRRIGARAAKQQRVLSVAAVMLLIAGVAGGVAIGRNTADRTTQTAKGLQSPTVGNLANGLAPDMAGGAEAASLGPLTHLFTRTANGVTLRVYVPQQSPAEPQPQPEPGSTTPGTASPLKHCVEILPAPAEGTGSTVKGGPTCTAVPPSAGGVGSDGCSTDPSAKEICSAPGGTVGGGACVVGPSAANEAVCTSTSDPGAGSGSSDCAVSSDGRTVCTSSGDTGSGSSPGSPGSGAPTCPATAPGSAAPVDCLPPESSGGGASTGSGSTGSGTSSSCAAWSQTVVVEASTGDVATTQVFTVGGDVGSFAGTFQLAGTAEGHPFAIVLAASDGSFWGQGTKSWRTGASMGSAAGDSGDEAVALPGGNGWLTAMALPLPAGASSLPDPITVNVPHGSELIYQALTLSNEAPSAATRGEACTTPSTEPPSTPTTVVSPCVRNNVNGGPAVPCPTLPVAPSTTVDCAELAKNPTAGITAECAQQGAPPGTAVPGN